MNEDRNANYSAGCSPYEGEHRYCEYWRLRISASISPVNRDDLESLISYPEYANAIADTVKRICISNRVSKSNLEWLQSALPDGSFARAQVDARLLVNKCESDNSYHAAIVKELLALHANWAAKLVFSRLGPADKAEAVVVVRQARAPKWVIEP